MSADPRAGEIHRESGTNRCTKTPDNLGDWQTCRGSDRRPGPESLTIRPIGRLQEVTAPGQAPKPLRIRQPARPTDMAAPATVPFPLSLRAHFRLSERMAPYPRTFREKDTKSETKAPDNPKSTNRARQTGTSPVPGCLPIRCTVTLTEVSAPPQAPPTAANPSMPGNPRHRQRS